MLGNGEIDVYSAKISHGIEILDNDDNYKNNFDIVWITMSSLNKPWGDFDFWAIDIESFSLNDEIYDSEPIDMFGEIKGILSTSHSSHIMPKSDFIMFY